MATRVSRGNRENWVKLHRQDWLQDQVTNLRRPIWDRVTYAALWRVGESGHARFEPGELAEAVRTVDRDGVVGPRPGDIGRDIAKAVASCGIGPGSTHRCLIVPSSVAQFGHGLPYEILCQHHKRAVAA